MLIVAAYFASYGLLGRIWWTYFVYGPNSVTLEPRQFDALFRGAGTFVVLFLPLVLLASYAVIHGLRRNGNPLIIDMTAWIVIGGATVLIQNWWSYQFMLFSLPSGSSPHSVSTISRHPRVNRRGADQPFGWWLWESAACRSQPSPLNASSASRTTTSPSPSIPADVREAYVDVYTQADRSEVFLHELTARPGDIQVFGDPIYLLRSGRRQAITIDGWSSQFHDARAWREVRDELDKTRPPYVMIDEGALQIIRERSVDTFEFLNATYSVLRRGADGVTWYELRSPL